MCATVPEAVAPRNTGRSLLRIFHLSPDTTIVGRSWFITDEITGRGTVPYAYNLIFRGRNDREAFLNHPAKAFSSDAHEPYRSFCARVITDAPAPISAEYDPKSADYTDQFVFSRNDWIESFGFDENLFTNYFANLYKAVCSRGNNKVGVILPGERGQREKDGQRGELLILATLSLLPMFMKKSSARRHTGRA